MIGISFLSLKATLLLSEITKVDYLSLAARWGTFLSGYHSGCCKFTGQKQSDSQELHKSTRNYFVRLSYCYYKMELI